MREPDNFTWIFKDAAAAYRRTPQEPDVDAVARCCGVSARTAYRWRRRRSAPRRAMQQLLEAAAGVPIAAPAWSGWRFQRQLIDAISRWVLVAPNGHAFTPEEISPGIPQLHGALEDARAAMRAPAQLTWTPLVEYPRAGQLLPASTSVSLLEDVVHNAVRAALERQQLQAY